MMFNYFRVCVAIGMTAIACAQTIGQTPASTAGRTDSVASGGHSIRWPAPVRHVQHDQELPMHASPTDAREPSMISPGAHLPPHQIIQAPGRRSTSNPTQKQLGHHARNSQTHPPHSSIQQRIQPRPAMLPEANRRETWKTPYSYGYFGASGKRQWSKHHGYRDRYTEWRLQ